MTAPSVSRDRPRHPRLDRSLRAAMIQAQNLQPGPPFIYPRDPRREGT